MFVCGGCDRTVDAENQEELAIVVCEKCKRELREELGLSKLLTEFAQKGNHESRRNLFAEIH